jgi:RNA polymerase sigma-70 factor, ECF subfamily
MAAAHRSPQSAAADDGVSAFVNARSRILAAAFRTLGNAAEAEDIVQDVWLRWQNVDRALVRNASAFLKTTTVRLAINRALGARMRHETPLELWLAEPVAPDAGPGVLAQRGQALESALLLLFETLSPMERAAYLLREAFDYSYRHIARVVDISEANSRQLVTRARKRLAEGRRLSVDAAEQRRVVAAFSDAIAQRDLAGLEALLLADILDAQAAKAQARETRPPSCTKVTLKFGARASRSASGKRACASARVSA